MGVVVGGVVTTVSALRGNTRVRDVTAAEVDMLYISAAARAYARLESKTPGSVESLLSAGYLVGENRSPFGGAYRIRYEKERFSVECSSPDGPVRGGE